MHVRAHPASDLIPRTPHSSHAELRFEGNIAPFVTATMADLDTSVTVSWAGGTIDIDVSTAVMAGTCFAKTVGFASSGAPPR